jgi:hypothetical protein
MYIPIRIGFNRVLPDGKIGVWVQTLTRCGLFADLDTLSRFLITEFGTDALP